MSCGEAVKLFENIPKIRRPLQMLCDVGLDYVTLGQSAPTLSGGEAERVKLAAELARPDTGTDALSVGRADHRPALRRYGKLLDVLNRLVDLGNTVVVIEHNLDVIKTADWVIDLGPEAGDEGGYVVAAGTPEDIVKGREGERRGERERVQPASKSTAASTKRERSKTGHSHSPFSTLHFPLSPLLSPSLLFVRTRPRPWRPSWPPDRWPSAKSTTLPPNGQAEG